MVSWRIFVEKGRIKSVVARGTTPSVAVLDGDVEEMRGLYKDKFGYSVYDDLCSQ